MYEIYKPFILLRLLLLLLPLTIIIIIIMYYYYHTKPFLLMHYFKEKFLQEYFTLKVHLSISALILLALRWLDYALIESRTNTGSRSASHRKKRAGPLSTKRGRRADLWTHTVHTHAHSPYHSCTLTMHVCVHVRSTHAQATRQVMWTGSRRRQNPHLATITTTTTSSASSRTCARWTPVSILVIMGVASGQA